MKILLFNLGSIERRIIAWDAEGYKSIFEHDVVLWGPIPDEEFIFNGKNIPIISIFQQTSIKTIFERLPDGWIPDIVACDTPVLNYIPDIHNCPVKTILFTRDAWADTIFNRKLVEIFDFISHSIVDILTYNKFHIHILPIAGFPVSLSDHKIPNPEFEKREIDIIAIANYDDGFYHDRYKTLYRLSDSNNCDHNIQYFKGLKRNEIHAYYKRSKIVIDWAHTLSNRSYEAAMNGCLLFSHEDNVAMKTFWLPGKEYVPYNDNNLFDLINYYIKNPLESKRIIDNSTRKIEEISVSFGQYTMENIHLAFESNINVQDRIKRIGNLDVSDLAYRTATPLLYNYRYETKFPGDWQEHYFERINNSLSASKDNDSRIAPLIEASRMAFLLHNYELAGKYLHELQKVLPNYAWIYYLQGRMYFDQNKPDQALLSLRKAIESAREAPELLQRFVLPVIEKGNSCDNRRITDYLWQSVYNHNNEYQVKALLHLTNELSGDVYSFIGESDNAQNAYGEAISYLPLPGCIKKAAPFILKSLNFEKLLEITEGGLTNSPYDSILVLYKALALLKTKQTRLAISIIKEHKNALKSFKDFHRIIRIRRSMRIIMISMYINKNISLKLILKIIRILE